MSGGCGLERTRARPSDPPGATSLCSPRPHSLQLHAIPRAGPRPHQPYPPGGARPAAPAYLLGGSAGPVPAQPRATYFPNARPQGAVAPRAPLPVAQHASLAPVSAPRLGGGAAPGLAWPPLQLAGQPLAEQQQLRLAQQQHQQLLLQQQQVAVADGAVAAISQQQPSLVVSAAPSAMDAQPLEAAALLSSAPLPPHGSSAPALGSPDRSSAASLEPRAVQPASEPPAPAGPAIMDQTPL